jgi:hypothetical protein
MAAAIEHRDAHRYADLIGLAPAAMIALAWREVICIAFCPAEGSARRRSVAILAKRARLAVAGNGRQLFLAASAIAATMPG